MSNSLADDGFYAFGQVETLNADEVISEDVFNELFALSDSVQKQKLISRLESRAKKLDVKNFKGILKAYQAKMIKDTKQRTSKKINFTDSPIGDLSCGKWTCNDSGVKQINEDILTNNEVVACPHPILITKRLEDIDSGCEKVKVEFLIDKKWKSTTVDRNIIASRGKIVDVLSGHGVNVTTESSINLVRYFSDLLALNPEEIPYVKGANRLGWSEDGFIPYTHTVEFSGESDYITRFKAIKEKGSYNEWLNCIKELRKDLNIKILMAASFASPLLDIVGGLPAIVHLWGTSGGGKTVALLVALSIWGNPRKMIGSLNSTDVARERLLSFNRNLPVAFDEMQTIKNNYTDFNKLIMTMCQGEGRARGTLNGLQDKTEWRNLILISGEEPINKSNAGGGSKNRVLEIETNGSILKIDGTEVCNVIDNNYGFLGKKYINKLEDLGKEEIVKQFTEIENQLKEYDIVQKQRKTIAFILLGDKLSNEYFNDELIRSDEIAQYSITEEEMRVAPRAYEEIIEWVASNQEKFSDDSKEVYGKINEGFVYIIASRLKDFLDSRNMDFDAIKRDLAKNNLLKKIKNEYTTNVRINKIQTRCIAIKLLDEEEKKELPF